MEYYGISYHICKQNNVVVLFQVPNVVAGDTDVVAKTKAGKLALTLPNAQDPTKTVHVKAIKCEHTLLIRKTNT